MEQRTSNEEPASLNMGDERREGAEHHVIPGALSHDAKQQLFIKKLYRLSQKHMDETPEQELAQHKVRSHVSSPLSQPTETEVVVTPDANHGKQETASSRQPPVMESFANRLSAITSCVALDYLCTGRIDDPSPKRIPKKKSPLLKSSDIPIPQLITLGPSHVSRLEDDDSLARHIDALARRLPPPEVVNVDDASKNSPQCVSQLGELAYEMEISKITPAPPKQVQSSSPKTKRRFTGFGGNHNKIRSSTSLEADEMEI
jgi:hypothetical protein